MSVRRVMNLTWLCAAVVAGSVLLASCGGGSSKTNGTTPTGASATVKPTGTGATVKVTLKEWTLTPDKASVPAGDVTFAATNAGTINHEFVVFKTDLAPDALKLSGDAVDEAASGQTKVDEIAEFAPGTTKTLTLTLQPGKYVLICNVAGHYQKGVHSTFTVTATAATGKNY